MQPLCWPNTVELTLSIQHSSELMLLFQRGVDVRKEYCCDAHTSPEMSSTQSSIASYYLR